MKKMETPGGFGQEGRRSGAWQGYPDERKKESLLPRPLGVRKTAIIR